MKLGRKWPITDREILDGLSYGKSRREIAESCGCSYQAIRKRLMRLVQKQGHDSAEQAVAHHVGNKIKEFLPLAFHDRVEMMMKQLPNTYKRK